MSKSLIFMITLAAAAVSTTAGALPPKDAPGGPGTPPPGRVSRAISWQEFKARCQDPQSFPDVQIEPRNIKVRCTESTVDFVQQAPGTIPLPGSRSIRTEVLSDKWYVSPSSREIQVEQKSGGCLRFKQVQRTFAYEVALACPQVLAFPGEPDEYCEQSMGKGMSHGGGKDDKGGRRPGGDFGKGGWGKEKELVDERDTGVTIDSCAGIKFE